MAEDSPRLSGYQGLTCLLTLVLIQELRRKELRGNFWAAALKAWTVGSAVNLNVQVEVQTWHGMHSSC